MKWRYVSFWVNRIFVFNRSNESSDCEWGRIGGELGIRNGRWKHVSSVYLCIVDIWQLNNAATFCYNAMSDKMDVDDLLPTAAIPPLQSSRAQANDGGGNYHGDGNSSSGGVVALALIDAVPCNLKQGAWFLRSHIRANVLRERLRLFLYCYSFLLLSHPGLKIIFILINFKYPYSTIVLILFHFDYFHCNPYFLLIF